MMCCLHLRSEQVVSIAWSIAVILQCAAVMLESAVALLLWATPLLRSIFSGGVGCHLVARCSHDDAVGP